MQNEKEGRGVFLVLAASTIFLLLLFCTFMIGGGLPAFFQLPLSDFTFGVRWAPEESPAVYGILPMLIGTCLVTLGAVLLAVPVGILTAVFLQEYCPAGIYPFYRGMIGALAGVPSVIFGFWGMLVLTPMLRRISGGSGYGLLTAVLLLAFMILPTVVEISESALREVPEDCYLGARALGAGRSRAVLVVEIRAARSRIRAGVILAVGRALGEATAVSMVAGNQPLIPEGLLSGVRTLTTGIEIEMGYSTGLHKQVLYAMGMILFLIAVGVTMTGREDRKE